MSRTFNQSKYVRFAILHVCAFEVRRLRVCHSSTLLSGSRSLLSRGSRPKWSAPESRDASRIGLVHACALFCYSMWLFACFFHFWHLHVHDVVPSSSVSFCVFYL